MRTLWFLSVLCAAQALRLGGQERAAPGPSQRKVVFDVGMNTGKDTESYLEQGYSVVAVEASPARINATISASPIVATALKDGRLRILNIGISNVSGAELDFFIPQPSHDSSDSQLGVWNISVGNQSFSDLISSFASFSKFASCRTTGACTSVKVKTKTCADLLRTEGVPHYMKIDVEGLDTQCVMDIMENLCGSAQLPTYVSFENFGMDTLEQRQGAPDVKELMSLMHARGYTKWKRSRTWATDYVQQGGRAGQESAFGEELLDLEVSKEWKPTSAFARVLGCDVGCSQATYTCVGLCDMHAKLDPVKADRGCYRH